MVTVSKKAKDLIRVERAKKEMTEEKFVDALVEVYKKYFKV